jgi:acetyl-CoA carboxylase carboxyl transferase subunit beta
MTRILAAGAVVRDRAGRFLLVLRAEQPQAGRWTVPGGKVQDGETLAEAAAREVLEETGVTVRVGEELGTLDLSTANGDVFEIHDFAAEYLIGQIAARDDAADVRWFTPEELPALSLTQGLLGYLIRYGVYP